MSKLFQHKRKVKPLPSRKKTQPIIHDSSSNTSLSQEEILALKRNNPTKALKRIQKLHKFSTGSRSSQSSDALLADIGDNSMNLLIQQLKENIFKVYLLISIEGDAQLGFDIRTLLVDLNKHRVSDSMVQFLFEFEAYFDQVFRDIDLKRINNASL